MRKNKFVFLLNIDNFKSIPFDKYENDFTFIVNGNEYKTNRLIADLLSPIIRKYHYQDQTIDRFVINTEQKNQEIAEYFTDFLNLIKFEEINIDAQHQKYFSEFFLKIGNFDEYLKFHPEFFEEIRIDNIIDRLKEMVKFNHANQFNFDKLISFAAEHFEEIDKNQLKKLDLEQIEEIIKNESLKLDEEDSLLNFILELYEKDEKYSPLFEYVNFNNINEKSFVSFINKFSIDNINSSIWRSMCQRILPSEKTKIIHERYHEKIIQFDHIKGQEFKGIMNYLCEKTGGNIHNIL